MANRTGQKFKPYVYVSVCIGRCIHIEREREICFFSFRERSNEGFLGGLTRLLSLKMTMSAKRKLAKMNPLKNKTNSITYDTLFSNFLLLF